MGNKLTTYLYSDTMPVADTAPTFDPLYGFSEGRKPRVMLASEEELRAIRAPKDLRDYCAHLLLDVEKCKKLNYPFIRRCSHEMHTHYQCQYDDYIMRMKEFERECRLRERQKRKQLQQPVAA